MFGVRCEVDHPEWVLAGDSHCEAWHAPAAQLGRAEGEAGLLRGPTQAYSSRTSLLAWEPDPHAVTVTVTFRLQQQQIQARQGRDERLRTQ